MKLDFAITFQVADDLKLVVIDVTSAQLLHDVRSRSPLLVCSVPTFKHATEGVDDHKNLVQFDLYSESRVSASFSPGFSIPQIISIQTRLRL